MANYNKVILAGNFTRDPELSYLPNQTPVVEFGLAINRRWRSQDGQQKEETCFVDCRCYGRQAEIIKQYMTKGRPMLVEGRLQFATWDAQDGSRRSKHRVIVENFQFLGGGQGGQGGQGGGQQGGQQQGGYAGGQPPQQQQAPSPPQQAPGGQAPPAQQPPTAYDQPGPGGDDIPF